MKSWRFAGALILVALVAGTVSMSSSRAAAPDVVVVRLNAPSIDASVRMTRPDGSGGTCPSAGRCTIGVYRGSTLTLTARDGIVSKFQGWTQGCGANGPPNPICTIQVNDDVVQVAARFSPLRLWYPSLNAGAGQINVETRSGQPGQPCGPECLDLPNGEVVTVRPQVLLSGYAFTGWTGVCKGVGSTHGCIIAMTDNKVVGGGFEPIPANCDPSPDQSCDPVGPSTTFTLQVKGKGVVIAAPMGSLDALDCQSVLRIGKSCRFDRLLEHWVDLKAIAKFGGRFLGWSGLCRKAGRSPCHFKNKPTLTQARRSITASFG
jgi:Divergent InlB B-repeat domain